MSKYVLCPRKQGGSSKVDATLERSGRRKQMDAIRAQPGRAERRGRLHDWLRSRKLPNDDLGCFAREPWLTGIEIVTMEDDIAAELGAAGLEYEVISDQAIPLVHEEKAKGPKTSSPDAWHLPLVNIDPTRRAATGRGINIAVLDTGIDGNHPALRERVHDTFKFDLLQRSVTSVPAGDTNGHGTHVAGIIAGKDFGIAPAARLVSGIAFPGTQSSTILLAFAMEWAASNPDVHIINVSGGFIGTLAGFEHAFDVARRSGALVVCAAGNEGAGASRSPANYEAALAVGAIDKHRQIPKFSSGGTTLNDVNVPDLVAPGVMISSSILGGQYQAWSGTSMAAPIVSGLAALLLELNPSITVSMLIDKLIGACVKIDHERAGAGLVMMPDS